FSYIQNTKNKVQISVTQWYQDYPGAADFLNVLFGCGSFHPGSDTSINISGFCDHAIQKQMDTAIGLTAVDSTAGNKLWAKVDRGDPVQPEEHRLHVEATGQLRLQRSVLLRRRPGLGAVR